jgi:hypothetical protein
VIAPAFSSPSVDGVLSGTQLEIDQKVTGNNARGGLLDAVEGAMQFASLVNIFDNDYRLTMCETALAHAFYELPGFLSITIDDIDD